MAKSYLFKKIRVLYDSKQKIKEDIVLISNGIIKSVGSAAEREGKALGLKAEPGGEKILAPCLVDPHSILETPFNNRFENIQSLIEKVANAGYGQVALMPRSPSWRDQSELLQGIKPNTKKVLVHLWGGFSIQGKGENLSKHKDLLENGAIGLAEDDFTPSVSLLKQGFLLGEMELSPVLLAARDKTIQGEGMARESVETLRAGWIPDPIESELLPLSQLLELHKQHPEIEMRLMNISTASGVKLLSNTAQKPLASVSWWHLVQDSSTLSPSDIGWTITPSLGSPEDRASLKKGLHDGVITAIAVHSVPLDDLATHQPSTERKKGISSYNLVLPLLWEELITKSGWGIEKLWEVLCFGPSKILKLPEEEIKIGSDRWILFDPNERWIQTSKLVGKPFIANQPYENKEISGKVIDSGLIY